MVHTAGGGAAYGLCGISPGNVSVARSRAASSRFRTAAEGSGVSNSASIAAASGCCSNALTRSSIACSIARRDSLSRSKLSVIRNRSI